MKKKIRKLITKKNKHHLWISWISIAILVLVLLWLVFWYLTT